MPKPLMFRGAIAAVLVLGVSIAHAALTPEEQCQKGRYIAAAKYAQCQDKALAQLFATNDLTKLQPALSKCRVTYTGTWVKLQKNALGTGSSCDTNRFVDNGNGTVTDHLTGLDWEKKTDDGTIHDKDDTYPWSNVYADVLEGDGSYHGLNEFDSNFKCFGNSSLCNWRLPTLAELQTILSAPFPCTTTPCIDAVFGPTTVSDYWSSTTLADNSGYAWGVFFGTGEVSYGVKTLADSVRAVRGGL